MKTEMKSQTFDLISDYQGTSLTLKSFVTQANIFNIFIVKDDPTPVNEVKQSWV